MKSNAFVLSVLLAACPAPLAAQQPEPATPTAPTAPTFSDAVESAKKAYSRGEHAAAVAALQAAILAVHEEQRKIILAALPKPQGFEFTDVRPKTVATDPFAASIATLGLSVERRYRKGEEVRFDIEVTANSPMVQMFAELLTDPARLRDYGGEVLDYGRHSAVLKDSGDQRLDLTIVMNDRHIIKVTAQGMRRESLLAIADREFIGRMEKPLGK